jgi:hypothetical protein
MIQYLIISAVLGIGTYYIYKKTTINNIASILHNVKKKYNCIKNIINNEVKEPKHKYYVNSIYGSDEICIYSHQDHKASLNNILYKDNTLYYFDDLDISQINDNKFYDNNHISKVTVSDKIFPLLVTYTLDDKVYCARICNPKQEWIFPFYTYTDISLNCSLEWDNLSDRLKTFAGPKGNFHIDIFKNTPDTLNSFDNLRLLDIFGTIYEFDKDDNIKF